MDFNLTPSIFDERGKRMAGQRVGYIRVSTFDQNPGRQLEGTELDRVFTGHVSGKVAPELEGLLRFVRAGDTVVVHSLDRLVRKTTYADSSKS